MVSKYRDRPPAEKLSHQHTLALNDYDQLALMRIWRHYGVTMAEAVRIAIREHATTLPETTANEEG